jgi:hypothetical protein
VLSVLCDDSHEPLAAHTLPVRHRTEMHLFGLLCHFEVTDSTTTLPVDGEETGPTCVGTSGSARDVERKEFLHNLRGQLCRVCTHINGCGLAGNPRPPLANSLALVYHRREPVECAGPEVMCLELHNHKRTIQKVRAMAPARNAWASHCYTPTSRPPSRIAPLL